MHTHSKSHCHPFGNGLRIFGLAIFGLLTAVIFGLLFGYFVELIWNWLMPSLFKLGKITYLQAFALVILARLIFGSFGHGQQYHHHPHPHRYYQHYLHGHEYRNRNLRDWKCYDLWWREEGKAAFDNYMTKMEHQDKES